MFYDCLVTLPGQGPDGRVFPVLITGCALMAAATQMLQMDAGIEGQCAVPSKAVRELASAIRGWQLKLEVEHGVCPHCLLDMDEPAEGDDL